MSRPNRVMNHGSPAAGRTISRPRKVPWIRSAARSSTDFANTFESSGESDSNAGTCPIHTVSGSSRASSRSSPKLSWVGSRICPPAVTRTRRSVRQCEFGSIVTCHTSAVPSTSQTRSVWTWVSATNPPFS